MTSTEINILVIDDEPDLCDLTKSFLDLQGERVVDTAYSAQGARNLLAYSRYDIILCDYKMPVENGIEFLASLRAAGSRIPFILFTGKEREEVVIEALNNGANGFVQKGGDVVSQFKDLENLIGTLVRQYRAEEALKESEVRFRDLAELIPAAIFEIDLSGKFTFLNRLALEMLGCTQGDFAQGIEAMDILVPGDRERALENIQEVLQNGETGSHEYTVLTTNGNTFRANITSSIILHQGHPVGLRGVVNAMQNVDPIAGK